MSIRAKVSPAISTSASLKKQVEYGSEYLKQNPILIFVCVVLLVIIILAIVYNTNDECKSSIDVILAKLSVKGTSNEDLKKKIRELEIVFFMSPTCPWCKKMVDVLKREGTYDAFKIVDVTTKDGGELAKKVGVLEKGVPNFVCFKLSTGVVGFKETTKEILDSLTNVQQAPAASAPTGSAEGFQDPIDKETLAKTGLIMFKMKGCEHCDRVLTELNQNGLTDAITIVDSKDPNLSKIVQDLKVNIDGFPTFFCRSNGKTVVGGRPLKDIVDVCFSQ